MSQGIAAHVEVIATGRPVVGRFVGIERDSHCGPVPAAALEADRLARRDRGRVEILNATRPGGMDGWTMDLRQYELLRELFLGEVAAAEDGVLLPDGRPILTIKDFFRFAGVLPTRP